MTQWIPLEGNDEVMNEYLAKLGLQDGQVAFAEIFGLDLLDMVPRPVKAVLLCFPITDQQEEYASEEAAKIAKDGQIVSPSIFYMHQSIGNACGTIGILHALGNLNSSERLVAQGSWLDGFFSAVKGFDAAQIGAHLEGDTQLEEVHEAAASSGQSEVPEDLENVNLHFICFTCVDGCLYELDGRKKTAINHGPSSPATVLEDSVAVIKKFMARDPDSIRFTMTALCAAEST